MLASYHNHSTWSDGRASTAAMIAQARNLGLGEIGLSDHFVVHPRGEQPRWAMRAGRLQAYIGELQAHRIEAEPRDPAVRIGLEVDWFPGHERRIAEALDGLPLDYVIGSVHYVGDFTIDGSARRWEGLSIDERDAVHEEYWRRMRTLAESQLYDIAAHLDLPKKFGYLASIDLRGLISDALDAIREADMVVELNTAGWHKPCACAYPSLEILRECRRRDIPVTLSADAHFPEHLVRDFERGAARIADAGYREIARFRERRRWMEPLEQALHAR
jgi:histidinol-phosphatase (PHP family)